MKLFPRWFFRQYLPSLLLYRGHFLVPKSELSNEKKSVVFKKITEPLALKRLELVNLLKKVKTQCENINSEKVLEYQEELNVQQVSKVLKK